MIRLCEIVKTKLTESSSRSKEAVVNIILSLVAKAISIISTLLIVPMTINYVNPTQYGIWLTLSSIISWVTFFDLGLGNGFRNKFAEAKANGDMSLARQYLSTTYFSIGVIVFVVFCVILIGNQYVNWTSILHVDECYREELGKIFVILSAFFCLNMVASLLGTVLTADQKPGISSLVQGGGQFCSLVVIYILTRTTEGSLTNLATYFAGVPCTIWVVVSVFVYTFSRYREIAPRIKDIRISLIREILNLGVQFFIIYMCILLISQVINIVISREVGPIAVTQYNIVYKYFNVLYMVMYIIVSPFWSAFTDAYVKKDFLWMSSIVSKLEKIWFINFFVGMLMVVLSSMVYRIWIGDSVTLTFNLTISVFIFIESQILGALYMLPINGIGTIRIQMITYIGFAAISLPLLVFACRHFEFEWVFLIPASVYLTQAILGKVQIHKLIQNKAKGIWIQ